MFTQRSRVKISPGFGIHQLNWRTTSGRYDLSAGEAPERDDADASLDDAARDEREYVRQRLREELKREPTDEELDEWLRQHTEGY